MTIYEFMQDKDILEKTLLWCEEEPEERKILPKCINASMAQDEVRDYCGDADKERSFNKFCPPT